MTQLRQPTYQAPLVARAGRITAHWQEWFTQVRRYLRAELVTGTATITINVADGANQSFDIPVVKAEQGDLALIGIDDAVPDGILLSAMSQSENVRGLIRNESGALYNPGAVTIRASAWKH